MTKIRAWFAENTSIDPKRLMSEYTIPEVEDIMKGFEQNNSKTGSSGSTLEGQDAMKFLMNNPL